MDISLEMFIYAQFRTVRNIISYGVFFFISIYYYYYFLFSFFGSSLFLALGH